VVKGISAPPKSASLLYTPPVGLSSKNINFFGNTILEVKNMKLWKNALLGYLGGMTYATIELLWRGRTHGSMFALGGICFLLIGKLGRVRQPLALPARAVVGALVVTMLELGCGLLVNRDYAVWDYRRMPLNYHGQICLPYTLLWIPVSIGAIWLFDRLDQGVDRRLFRLTFGEDNVK
jgi:uncharacterized membrane protein